MKTITYIASIVIAIASVACAAPEKPSCSEMRATSYEIEINEMSAADQAAIVEATSILKEAIGVNIKVVSDCNDNEFCTKFVYVTPAPNAKEIILASFLGDKMLITKGVWFSYDQAVSVFTHELTHQISLDHFSTHSATMHSSDKENLMYRSYSRTGQKLEHLTDGDINFICSNGR